MDKQRTFFYGFVVGFGLMLLPIPNFFFWQNIEYIEAIFRNSGFVLIVVCAIPLILDVYRKLFNK